MTATATLDVLSLPIANLTQAEALDQLFRDTPVSAFFINAHCVNVAAMDPVYRGRSPRRTGCCPMASALRSPRASRARA